MAMVDAEIPFLPAADPDQAPVAGASDYRGRPVYRNTSGRWSSALFVVGTYAHPVLAKLAISFS
jgi:hypothetical protein